MILISLDKPSKRNTRLTQEIPRFIASYEQIRRKFKIAHNIISQKNHKICNIKFYNQKNIRKKEAIELLKMLNIILRKCLEETILSLYSICYFETILNLSISLVSSVFTYFFLSS